MSALDTQGVSSEDKVSQEEVGNVRTVPVAESIRYHKRAQSAERRAEELAGELAEVRSETGRLADELRESQQDQKLTKRLAAEGARDLEVALLIARSRLAREDKADMAGVVEQLKREKGYLFGEKSATGASIKTSPAKEQRGGTGVLERAAKKAAGTGSRADLQEYMRKRRSVI